MVLGKTVFYRLISLKNFQKYVFRNAEHILASGSVDKTVLIWDLHTGKVASTLTAHKELIQALQWHPFEAQNLLTGSTDKYVKYVISK